MADYRLPNRGGQGPNQSSEWFSNSDSLGQFRQIYTIVAVGYPVAKLISASYSLSFQSGESGIGQLGSSRRVQPMSQLGRIQTDCVAILGSKPTQPPGSTHCKPSCFNSSAFPENDRFWEICF